MTLDDVRHDALRIAPERSAISLIDDADAVEKDLSNVEQAVMVQRGDAKIGTAPAESAANT